MRVPGAPRLRHRPFSPSAGLRLAQPVEIASCQRPESLSGRTLGKRIIHQSPRALAVVSSWWWTMWRMKALRNVYRRDRNDSYFHGWEVLITRRGQLVTHKMFSDAVHDGRKGSLDKAIAYRDRMLIRLPPPTKTAERHVRNTTGVIGVRVHWARDRHGRRVRYYCASWQEVDGERPSRYFRVRTLGERRAFELAVKARKEALTRVLAERRRMLAKEIKRER